MLYIEEFPLKIKITQFLPRSNDLIIWKFPVIKHQTVSDAVQKTEKNSNEVNFQKKILMKEWIIVNGWKIIFLLN